MVSAETDRVFLQSINVLISLLGNLSDATEEMRYKIMTTDLLIHLANTVSFFSELSEDEEKVSTKVLKCKQLIFYLYKLFSVCKTWF